MHCTMSCNTTKTTVHMHIICSLCAAHSFVCLLLLVELAVQPPLMTSTVHGLGPWSSQHSLYHTHTGMHDSGKRRLG